MAAVFVGVEGGCRSRGSSKTSSSLQKFEMSNFATNEVSAKPELKPLARITLRLHPNPLWSTWRQPLTSRSCASPCTKRSMQPASIRILDSHDSTPDLEKKAVSTCHFWKCGPENTKLMSMSPFATLGSNFKTWWTTRIPYARNRRRTQSRLLHLIIFNTPYTLPP
jgi:hypothetical protein